MFENQIVFIMTYATERESQTQKMEIQRNLQVENGLSIRSEPSIAATTTTTSVLVYVPVWWGYGDVYVITCDTNYEINNIAFQLSGATNENYQ